MMTDAECDALYAAARATRCPGSVKPIRRSCSPLPARFALLAIGDAVTVARLTADAADGRPEVPMHATMRPIDEFSAAPHSCRPAWPRAMRGARTNRAVRRQISLENLLKGA
ncbi:hypothetical protein KPA94_17005 [Burkholderia semiarida]|uniref:hypothetical protein n=1 Tax=Burkholderia semiarida TaxID=2843303 RepID=UPI0023DE0205|nr:hypothetical protein [Burkholderia semiarida]MDF3115138.1 hypothetical protein [Burkholderia semiarida]